ncbi:metallophosphoesterase family protein [Ramlibacter albus]|uniref:Phosphoesterase n=1 Tax=Ramlibacter albus TaxID=2079448 RepID=A0A923MEF2_9BURK|nr:metallophosphoesterase family protein [Ramlibacter albus]MBC5767983.1 metallophosphoesterase family protein [Ramlibacter albus]
MQLRLGVISDTHDLVGPAAFRFLQGCDRILHAGDICGAEVLDELAKIAPVTAVRGNNDRGDWARKLRETERVELGGVAVYIIHDLKQIDIDPKAAGVRVVISGHSHRPRCDEVDGVLYFNPGSAGPRRFNLPISIGELVVGGGKVSARLVDLETLSSPAGTS